MVILMKKNIEDCLIKIISGEKSPDYISGYNQCLKDVKKSLNKVITGKGDIIVDNFTHICKGNGPVNEFSIFANIVKDNGDTVTIERYQSFGNLNIPNITLSKDEFNSYYEPIEDCKDVELLY